MSLKIYDDLWWLNKEVLRIFRSREFFLRVRVWVNFVEGRGWEGKKKIGCGEYNNVDLIASFQNLERRYVHSQRNSFDLNRGVIAAETVSTIFFAKIRQNVQNNYFLVVWLTGTVLSKSFIL